MLSFISRSSWVRCLSSQASSPTPVPGTCQICTVNWLLMATGLLLPHGISNWEAPSGICRQDMWHHEIPSPATLPFLERAAYTKHCREGVWFCFCEFFVKASQKFMCREKFSLTLSLLIKSSFFGTSDRSYISSRTKISLMLSLWFPFLLVTIHTRGFFQGFSSF